MLCKRYFFKWIVGIVMDIIDIFIFNPMQIFAAHFIADGYDAIDKLENNINVVSAQFI